MESIYNYIGITANLFDAFAGVVFICLMYNREDRRQHDVKLAVWSAFYIAVLTILPNIFGSYVIQCAMVAGVLVLYSRHMFISHTIWQFIYSILFTAAIVVASALTNIFCTKALLLPASEVIGELGINRFIGYLFDKIILVALLTIIILIKKKRNDNLIGGEWQVGILLFIASLCIGSSALQAWNSNSNSTKHSEQILIFILNFILLYVASFVCIYKLNSRQKLELENEIMRAKLEEEQNMISKLRDMYENDQIIRHDLKRYLTIVQGLLINDDIDGAKKYIKDTIDVDFKTPLSVYTNSSIVNAVLTDRKNLCEKSGIEFKISICGEIPEAMQSNIGIIISNLLENAYEAELSEPEDKRSIIIYMKRQKGMYYIHIDNFISKSVMTNNSDLSTIKSDKKNHGFGIRSVKKMAANADGSCSFYENDYRFVAEISLPVS